MARYVRFRDFDWVLLVFVLIICALGIVEIYSATRNTKFDDANLQVKQVYWIIAGMILMFLVSLVNYQTLLEHVHWMYGLAIVSLLAVMIFGRRYLGAKRWIAMPGGWHFQPSEWVKLILILAMAKYFADYHERVIPFREVIKSGAIVIVPMPMVLNQPDLGTSLTYLPIA